MTRKSILVFEDTKIRFEIAKAPYQQSNDAFVNILMDAHEKVKELEKENEALKEELSKLK